MKSKLTLAVFLVLSMRGIPTFAYTFFQGGWPCSSAPQRWAPLSSGVRYIFFNDQCLSGANYNSSVTPAGMQSAGAWGSWMWRREGVNRVELVYNVTWCVGWWTPGDTSWFYSGNSNRYGLDNMSGSSYAQAPSQMFDIVSNIVYMVHHAAIPGGLSMRLAVMAPGYPPAPENSLWLGPTVTIPSNWTFAGATYQYPMSANNIPGGVGGTDAIGLHRVWIQLDPSDAIAETDEGDNWIPTRWMLRRVDGC